MVASYVRERNVIFLRWLENVERLLGRHVDRDAAFEAWTNGYSVREYAGEVIAPSSVSGRATEEDWGRR
jgi:hypothetical protein